MTVPTHDPHLHITLLNHPWNLYPCSLETGFYVGSFVNHNCAEYITWVSRSPALIKFDYHAMSAPALAQALQELVSEDPKVGM
jgi:hypothetical protein